MEERCFVEEERLVFVAHDELDVSSISYLFLK